MADDYSVDTGVLRQVADFLDGQATGSQSLVDRARSTDVPPLAWGELGRDFGLHDLYGEVREQADVTLHRIQDFLGWAAQNLTATAGEYDDHEVAVAARFEEIGGTEPRKAS